MRRILLVLVLSGAIAGSLALRYWFGSSPNRQASKTAAGAISPPDKPPVQPTARPDLSPPHLSPGRAALRKEIESTLANGCSDVEAQLDSLEGRARKQGEVTALEIQPGLALLRRCSDPEEVDAFSQRMLRLQTELGGGAPPAPAPDPLDVRRQLDQLSGDIQHSNDERQKQALIRRYRDLARNLEPEEGNDAMMELNRIASSKPSPPEPTAADTLWKAIERETDESKRQVLIRDYLDLMPGLPESERQVRTATLTRRFGKPASP